MLLLLIVRAQSWSNAGQQFKSFSNYLADSKQCLPLAYLIPALLTLFLQVVERSRAARSNARDARIRSYFYGKDGELSPHCFYIDFADVKVFQIGGNDNLFLSWVD